MLIGDSAKKLLLLVCVLLCGCGPVLRVTKFDPHNPQGVPFYIKHGVCVQQTVYANPYWRLTLTQSFADGAPISETLNISEAGHDGGDFKALVQVLGREGGPDSLSVQTAWKQLEDADRLDPWEDTRGQRLVSNNSSLVAEVDYQTVYAINQKKPFSGSAQSDFKLNTDGTLNESSGQIQDNTFATIVSALPLSSLITSAAGIKSQPGKSEEKPKVPATFALKQEQRYINIVYSQSIPASQSPCKIGPPLKPESDNVAIALSDVGSTDTPQSGTTDKSTDSITINGTIKLPKTLQPSTPGQNASDAENKTNAAPAPKPGAATDKTNQKGKN